MRAFIAVECPDELQEKLTLIQNEFKVFGIMKLVEAENIHMTLRFIGEVEEEIAEKITASLEALKEMKKFKVSVKSVGAFPKPEYIKVLWAGVEEGVKELEIIKDLIENIMIDSGFEKDTRFHPHFTLARVRSIDNKDGITDYLKSNTNRYFGEFEVSRILLMKSELQPAGPKYTIVHKYLLS